MGRSREELLERIRCKVEDFFSFSEHSNSQEKNKCQKQLSHCISDYFTSSSGDEDNNNNEEEDKLNTSCDYSSFEKMMTRDILWFSMSSFKKGMTQIIGKMLLTIAAARGGNTTRIIKTFASIFIKISCMVFQWNNSSDSLTHATIFLVFLRDVLLLHPDSDPASPTDKDKDKEDSTYSLFHSLHSSLLQEMKLTKISPPNVTETRVFMIFCTLKTVVLARPSFPVTETLVSLLHFASQLKNLPKICDTNSTSSQHISFRLQKMFVDDGGARALSRISHQNCLDISSEYHISDHQSAPLSHTVNTSSSSSSSSSSYMGTKTMSSYPSKKSSGKEKKCSGPSLEKWLPKELHNWILIRRHPFTSSSLCGVLSHLLRGWSLDSYDTGRKMFEHLDRTLMPLLHSLLSPQQQRTGNKAKNKDKAKRKGKQKQQQQGSDTESYAESGTEREVMVTQRMGGAWVQAAMQVLVVSVAQSPVMYMHSLLEQTCRAVCRYYEHNFTVDPTREGHYMPSSVDLKKTKKKNKKKMKMKENKNKNKKEDRTRGLEVYCASPVEAVNGLKLGCHVLCSLLSHFTCVSPKDVVYAIIFLSNLIDNSITLLRQEHFGDTESPPLYYQSLRACTDILSSYLAYILIHQHHVVHAEIFKLRNIVLRDALMTLYEDSLAPTATAAAVSRRESEGADGGGGGGDWLQRAQEEVIHSKEDADSGGCSSSSNSSNSSDSCSFKCIDSTHPLLASYLCAVTLPRLGIVCTCTYTPLHSSLSLSLSQQLDSLSAANDWFEQQVHSQAYHFSTADLLSLDLSQLWSSSAGTCSDSCSGNVPTTDEVFPIHQWPCHRTDEGSTLPNIHTFFQSDIDINNMKDAAVSFILQSTLSFGNGEVDEEDEEEEEGAAEEDRRRRVNAADRVFAYDICVLLMGYVSYKRVCRLACVNKQFSLAAVCPLVWAQKYRDRFGSPLFDTRPAAVALTLSPVKKKISKANKKKQMQTEEDVLPVEEVALAAAVSPPTANIQQRKEVLLCRHCYPATTTSSHTVAAAAGVATAGSKQTACCDGLAKQHNWLYLFQSMMMLGKSLKLQHLKNKKGNVKNIPKICTVVGCVFTYRTEKQREGHFSKQHHIQVLKETE